MSDFKFNLFYTKVSSSLCSLNRGLHLLYRKKKICHSLTMKCCTGNNLISSVFKTEMPWGKLAHSFRSAESQRYSTSYSEKYGGKSKMESTVSSRSHGDPEYFPEQLNASPEGEIWATMVWKGK